MAELLSEKNRLRNQHFETWQEAAYNSLASQPHVLTALGHLSIQLISENNAAFLPNIRHRYTTIPRSQRSNDAPAVIPMFDDEKLYLGPSFGQPIVAKRAASVAYKCEDLLMRALGAFVQYPSILTGDDDANGAIFCPKDQVLARTQHLGYKSALGGSHVARPTITFRSSDFQRLHNESDYASGAVANHEYAHAIDIKEQDLNDRNFKALTELRAYHITRLIMDRPCPPPHTELVDILFESVNEAEHARNHYGIPSAELIKPSFTLTAAHAGLEVPGADPVVF